MSAPTTILSHLPLDMLDVILRHVETADLASVSRTSRVFSARALDALYRDVLLTNNHSLNFCFSVLDDISLAKAKRVKSLAIHSADCGSFYGVIQETLAMLPHLRLLELFMGDDASCQWILPIDHCPFQLCTFLTDFQYTSDVGTFIAGQHGIRNLTVPWSGGPNYFGNLEFLGLRYLTKIFAPFSLVEALVPGRPVREVATFRDRENIRPDRIRCLTQSTSGIKRLQINVEFLHEIGPELLAETLPSLSCLAITCVEPKEPELAVWISEFLARIPRLHCFNVRLDLRFGLHAIEYPYMSTLSGKQELRYFAVSVIGRRNSGRAWSGVHNQWTLCSEDEIAWVLAHSTFN
ncbi:hypothetical protein C8R44DRAFT_871236 [Mycena epipterygia]|nr:hypothetical protein C8R44DRAFT_871236 [Mycena epipterygia]